MRRIGRLSVVAVLLLGLMTLMQLRSGYHLLEQTLAIRPITSTKPLVLSAVEGSGQAASPFATSGGSGQASAVDQSAFERTRDGLIAVHGGSLLSPYAELFMSSLIEINNERLKEKLELNTRVMRFVPIGAVVYRQALLLAQAGRQAQARAMLEQAIWSYPGNFADARRQMAELAEKDYEHFSSLLEFALQKEQEYRRAVRQQ